MNAVYHLQQLFVLKWYQNFQWMRYIISNNFSGWNDCNCDDFKSHFELLEHISCSDIQCVGSTLETNVIIIIATNSYNISDFKLQALQQYSYDISDLELQPARYNSKRWSCNQTLAPQQHSKQSVTTLGTRGTHAAGRWISVNCRARCRHGSRGGWTSPSGVTPVKGIHPTGLRVQQRWPSHGRHHPREAKIASLIQWRGRTPPKGIVVEFAAWQRKGGARWIWDEGWQWVCFTQNQSCAQHGSGDPSRLLVVMEVTEILHRSVSAMSRRGQWSVEESSGDGTRSVLATWNPSKWMGGVVCGASEPYK
jgi:hypothetical protein